MKNILKALSTSIFLTYIFYSNLLTLSLPSIKNIFNIY